MKTPIEVIAHPAYRLKIHFDDGVEGIVDLSEFVGKGPFEAWDDVSFFQRVVIGPHREIQLGRRD